MDAEMKVATGIRVKELVAVTLRAAEKDARISDNPVFVAAVARRFENLLLEIACGATLLIPNKDERALAKTMARPS